MTRPIVWTPRAHRLADLAGLTTIVIFGALMGLAIVGVLLRAGWIEAAA